MSAEERYESARGIYGTVGVNTEAAVGQLRNIPISAHCWQGGDVMGLKNAQTLSGGIQATGNYPDRVRNPQELMSDVKRVLSLVPGKHRLSPHASYAVFEEGEKIGRDQLEPKHFVKQVEFTEGIGLGLGLNPTMFFHPKAENAASPSEDSKTWKLWVGHCRAYIRISQYLAEELGAPCFPNIRILDGFKDIPVDRTSLRTGLKDPPDRTLDIDYCKERVLMAMELEVLDAGTEGCMMGSHESRMNYTTPRGIMCLLNSGHFHFTEVISDKVFFMPLFSPQVTLHVSRPMHWNSDHAVLFDDEAREIAKEIVRNDPKGVLLALDFFDASINRTAAWMVGMGNMQKALSYTLPVPRKPLVALQEERRFTELMMLQEEFKTYPFGDVRDHFYEEDQVPVKEQWPEDVKIYE